MEDLGTEVTLIPPPDVSIAHSFASLRPMLFHRNGFTYTLNMKQEAARLRTLERKLEALAVHPDTSQEHRSETKLRLEAVRSEVQVIEEKIA